jgi:hypothetical protein
MRELMAAIPEEVQEDVQERMQDRITEAAENKVNFPFFLLLRYFISFHRARAKLEWR